MTKYSKEFRLKLVMEIEGGQSIKGTARKYNINRNLIRDWWRRYSAGGVEQLIATRQRYSQAFKLHAIGYRWPNDISYSQAAADLGIPSYDTLYQWEKRYLEQGLDGLQDIKKGRPSNMSNKDPKPKNS